MSRGETHRIREENLRLSAAVAEIEGLYTALLRTSGRARRRRLLRQLALAGRRLALPAGGIPRPKAPGEPVRAAAAVSRRQRRQALAERGAAWIIARYGPGAERPRR